MIGVAMFVGCTPKQAHYSGESVVLAGTQPANLLHTGVRPGAAVRSTYLPGGTAYEEGKDFVVDREAGTIARTPASRIPDFSKNILYGKTDFDHSRFPGYGNVPFTVYVDYDAPVGSDAAPARRDLGVELVRKVHDRDPERLQLAAARLADIAPRAEVVAPARRLHHPDRTAPDDR